MPSRPFRALIALVATLAAWPVAARAETIITPTDDVAELVDAFAGAGINIIAATVESGTVSQAGPSYNDLTLTPQGATGTFEAGPLAIAHGALLTSGDIQLALPPNETEAGSLDGASGIHGADALDDDPFCDMVIGNPQYPSRDVVRLTLDFTLDPDYEGVEVTYVFGSEEFPDYLDSLYADAFGVFVRAAGTDTYDNIGLDGDGQPININGPYFSGDRVISTMAGDGDPGLSGYNGLTPKITNAKPLPSGPEYVHQLVVVVCDATDRYLDSGLFVSSIAGCQGGACAALRYCGNGTVDPGELCDDGNNDDTDDCTNACSPCYDDQPGGGVDHGCEAAEPVCASFGGDLSDCTLCDDDTVGDVDSGCGAPNPACLRTEGGEGSCVECTVDADCETSCDLETHTCTPCIDDTASGLDAGCDALTPACDEDAAGGPACVECTVDGQCPGEICGEAQLCAPCEDTAAGPLRDHGCGILAPLCADSGSSAARCVPCIDDTDNTGGAIDVGCSLVTPSCDESGVFGPVCLGCETNAQCGSGKVCAPNGACVPCHDSAPGASQDAGCPFAAPICDDSGLPSAHCTPCVDDRVTSTDTGCSAALPACDESAPASPVCVGCTVDAQCGPGAICDTHQDCVPCEDTQPGGGLDDGCGFETPICTQSGTPSAHCVACVDTTVVGTDRGCASPTPACDETAEGGPECVGCTGDGQCAVGTVCTTGKVCRPCEDTAAGAALDDGCAAAKPICANSGTDAARCVPCVDDTVGDTDTGCVAAFPACDPAAPGGPTCVPCTRSEQCGDEVCSTERTCVPCQDTAAGGGVDRGCNLGVALCVESGTPSAHCVPCVDDTAADIDTGCFGELPACDESGPTCVGCTSLAQCEPDRICGSARACVVCEDTALGAGRDAGCTLDAPLCVGAGTDTARCAPCVDDQDGATDTGCSAAVPHCLSVGEALVACFPCVTDDDCPFGDRCNDAHACEDIPNAPPVAVDDLVEVDEDGAVLIAPLANDFDPEGEPLSLGDTLLAAPRAGDAVVREDGSVLYTPRADRHGPDWLSYEVCDAGGACDMAFIYILVRPVEDLPVAVDDHAATPTEELVAIAVLANDRDPDGEPLFLEGFGDPAHGTTAQGADDKVLYSSEAGYTGTDSFTYTVRDAGGATVTATVTIDVGGAQGPTARDDDATVDEDGSVVIDVIANDEGDGLVLSSVGPAAHGETSIEEGGLRYTPDGDFAGQDAFSYTVCDGADVCTAARVAVVISPLPDPPLALDEVTSTAGSLELDPTPNDLDVDGDPIAVVFVASPWHGEATLGEDGRVSYTPPGDFTGYDVIEYTLEDDTGELATARLVVEVRAEANDAPVAADDAFAVGDDAPTGLDVLTNDSDDDPLTVVDVQEPARGFVRFGAPSLVYEPEAGFCGEVTFTYTVSDSGGAESAATVVLDVGDRDEDGLCDSREAEIGTDPEDPDTDGDGLGDAEEDSGPTSPTDADTDDDGIADGDEGPLDLDPVNPDSDGDGLSDGLEIGVDTPVPGGSSDGDPAVAYLGTDVDADAWQPDGDPQTTTDPLDPDTDDDGLLDGTEDADHDGAVADETDPNDADSDDDGLLDGTERGLATPEREEATDLAVFVADADPATVTDPLDPDTDDGGVIDGEEDENGNGAVDEGERDPLFGDDDVPRDDRIFLEGGGGCGGGPAAPLTGAWALLLLGAWLLARARARRG